jgi:Na+/proline symporter
LAFFLIITFFSVYLNKSLYTGDAEKRTETYVAARNTQGSLAIALSFFASGAGAWVLFTVPEAAILGGPVAIAGYTVACLVPVAIFGCVGPYMRRNLPQACTFFEYIQARYGTLVNVYCTLVSIFYMLLYLSAEFTSVGSCVVSLSELTSPLGPVISTALVTIVYTSIGGLPVSLFTDKVQGAGILVFTVLVCVAAFGFYELPTRTNDEAVIANWQVVTTWGIGGTASNSFKMAFILVSAITCANLMHSGFQQRIWAAQGDAQVRRGAIGGILLTIPFMALFGVLGMISFANYGIEGLVAVGPDNTYLAFLAAFFLIGAMPVAWQVRG